MNMTDINVRLGVGEHALDMWHRFCDDPQPASLSLVVSALCTLPLGFAIQHVGMLIAVMESITEYAKQGGYAPATLPLAGLFSVAAESVKCETASFGDRAEYILNRYLYLKSSELQGRILALCEEQPDFKAWLETQERFAGVFTDLVLQ